jgi:hypothetical protein
MGLGGTKNRWRILTGGESGVDYWNGCRNVEKMEGKLSRENSSGMNNAPDCKFPVFQIEPVHALRLATPA